MMNLNLFKSLYGIEQIPLAKSEKTGRLFGKVLIEGELQSIVSTVEFDSAKPVYVYTVTPEGSTDEIFVLSNKGAEVVVTL
jgi:hypothetical protein